MDVSKVKVIRGAFAIISWIGGLRKYAVARVSSMPKRKRIDIKRISKRFGLVFFLGYLDNILKYLLVSISSSLS